MSDVMTAPAAHEKIKCEIDGALTHSIQNHLKNFHPSYSIEEYRRQFPTAPLFSELAKQQLAKRQAEKAEKAAEAAPPTAATNSRTDVFLRPMAEVFDLGSSPLALSARKEPIMIDVFGDHDAEAAEHLPEIDHDYVFNVELTKKILIGLALNMPVYFWGFHGTGKTTAQEQACARTKRPFLRLQHTANTEEAHILGQWIIKDGQTEFSLGPLPIAMMNGWVYCADEYDFAMPSVLAVYQPVLEGKALYIKDAPAHLRMIKPHPNFRIMATGNTNGGGDETGLYQGTQIQNAANYSRFGIVEEVEYMEPKIETLVIAGKAGIQKDDAGKLVEWAKKIRDEFAGGRIGTTISPRELIAIGKIGRVMGANWKAGIKSGFTNRLSRGDRGAIDGFTQRIFG